MNSTHSVTLSTYQELWTFSSWKFCSRFLKVEFTWEKQCRKWIFSFKGHLKNRQIGSWRSAALCLGMSVGEKTKRRVIRQESKRPGGSHMQGWGDSVRCWRWPVLAKLCKNHCVSKWNGHFSVSAVCSFGNVLLKSFCSPNLNSLLIFRKHF